jgi:predicted amidohydrolase
MGPIARSDSRRAVVARLVAMLRESKKRGASLVVFPELALTTFFPRWLIDAETELESFFERSMPGPETAILFEESRRLGVGFYLGYAELAIDSGKKRYFNTSILVDQTGTQIGKYRKIHLPGHAAPQPGRHHQHLEKRYFMRGDLGFPVWRAFETVVGMCLCNDRRWPETYRMLGLQGAELVVLGYNTPLDHTGFRDIDDLSNFHNHLSMQAGAYQNASWVVGTAKCGCEEGSDMIGQSAIIAPSGEIIAMTRSLDDEIIVANCDFEMGRRYRETIFDFARHREPSQYGLIVERKGARPPPLG